MEYIRENKFRGGENWPSNLRHCLYGLDADLIMLGMHFVYFVYFVFD